MDQSFYQPIFDGYPAQVYPHRPISPQTPLSQSFLNTPSISLIGHFVGNFPGVSDSRPINLLSDGTIYPQNLKQFDAYKNVSGQQSIKDSLVFGGVAAVAMVVVYTGLSAMTAPATTYMPVMTNVRPVPRVAPLAANPMDDIGAWLDKSFVKPSGADLGYPGYEEDLKGSKGQSAEQSAPKAAKKPAAAPAEKKGWF